MKKYTKHLLLFVGLLLVGILMYRLYLEYYPDIQLYLNPKTSRELLLKSVRSHGVRTGVILVVLTSLNVCDSWVAYFYRRCVGRGLLWAARRQSDESFRKCWRQFVVDFFTGEITHFDQVNAGESLGQNHFSDEASKTRCDIGIHDPDHSGDRRQLYRRSIEIKPETIRLDRFAGCRSQFDLVCIRW